MGTEANNQRSRGITEKTTEEILRLIHEEDKTAFEAVGHAVGPMSEATDIMVSGIRSGGRVIYAGAGTSGRVAVQDLVELEPTYGLGEDSFRYIMAGGEAALVKSKEGAEDDREDAVKQFRLLNPTVNDVVVGISASGRTPFVVAILEEASSMNIKTIGIVNNKDSQIEKVATVTIVLDTGAEVIQGSSRMKAGTAQKMALNMMSTALAVKLGRTYDNMMSYMGVQYNMKLLNRAVTFLVDEFSISREEASRALEKNDYKLWLAIEEIKKGK